MMDMFNFIAGMASIISLILSLISLVKVNDVQKMIKSKQSIDDSTISNSSVVQVGGDYTKPN